MKKFILLYGAVATMLAVASCQKESMPETEFLSETESISAGAEGGEFTINYTLNNPREGMDVSASSGAEWITDFDYSTDGVIAFNISPNVSETQREDKIEVAYGELKFSVPVTQEGNPSAAWDSDIVCSSFAATYYGDAYETYTHFMIMSDKEVANDGSFDPQGTYYVLYLTRILDETATAAFTNGEYTVDPENSYSDWTICTEHSYVVSKSSKLRLAGGSMTISGNGIDDSTFELLLTLDDGSVHHAVYTGAQYGEDHSIDWVTEDVEMTAGSVIASFIEGEGDPDYKNNNINITLYSGLDENGWVEVPGYALILVGNVQFDDTGYIIPGTYPISHDDMVKNGFQAGKCTSFMNSPFPSGTNIRYFYVDNQQQMVGLVVDGEVIISGDRNEYTVECNLVTREGVNIHAVWVGELEVEGAPGKDEFSKYYLTDDYELSFPAKTDNFFRVSSFKNTWQYDGAVAWSIRFFHYNENYAYDGDQLELEFFCSSEYSDAPMEGTYKVGTTKGEIGTLTPGTFEPGETTNNNWPTYFRNMDNGNTSYGAAAKGGEMTLTKNDDGTWTVQFDFTDQQENAKHFTGSWTGEIEW